MSVALLVVPRKYERARGQKWVLEDGLLHQEPMILEVITLTYYKEL